MTVTVSILADLLRAGAAGSLGNRDATLSLSLSADNPRLRDRLARHVQIE